MDYYKILGITKNATEKEIKAAYRRLARKYHPDLNPTNKEAETRFKEVNEANTVLGDPEKRKKYDAYGQDWENADAIKNAQQQSYNRQNSSQPYQDASGDDFSDFFASMYGKSSNGGRQTRFRGQDLNATLQLNLQDVYQAQKQTLTVNGKSIRLSFPAGIENGQVIKIAGYGAPSPNGGPSGDLYITFSILNNTPFKRDGSSLYSTLELNLFTALLGGEVVVNTFDGQAKLHIAPGTQCGTKVKLKGKGFPAYKSAEAFGDLYVTYQVKLPTILTEKEKALFTEIQQLQPHEN